MIRCSGVPAALVVVALATATLLFVAGKLRGPLTQPYCAEHAHILPPGWNAHMQNCTAYMPATTEDRLLVIVIAGGSKPVYAALRGYWRLIQKQVAESGVFIYLVGLSPSLQEPKASEGSLLFPGTESLVPGVLFQTLEALQYVFDHQLPGYSAKYVLRTNLSSFWIFSGLLAWLQEKSHQQFVAAVVGYHNGHKDEKFPSGAGTVLSTDVANLLLHHRREIDLNTIDDVAIGRFLAKRSLEITPMSRNDTFIPNVAEVPSVYSCHSFHYRVKADSGSQLQDVAAFSSLFLFWYGPSTTL